MAFPSNNAEHVNELTGAGWISPRLLSYFDTPAQNSRSG
jgi:hypothetical protein